MSRAIYTHPLNAQSRGIRHNATHERQPMHFAPQSAVNPLVIHTIRCIEPARLCSFCLDLLNQILDESGGTATEAAQQTCDTARTAK